MSKPSSGPRPRPRIKAPADFIGGVLLLLFALVVLIQMNRIPVQGSALITAVTVPRLFLGVVVLMACIVIVASFYRDEPVVLRPRLRSAIFIIGGILTFAIGMRPLGLALTGFLAVLVASFADDDVRPLEALVSALVLATFCTVLFVTLLGLPLQIWPDRFR